MDIDINNSPDVGNNGNSNDEAVIALSIVLALVLLGIIAGLLYYKRRLGVVDFNFLRGFISFHRPLIAFINEKMKRDSSQSVRSSSSDLSRDNNIGYKNELSTQNGKVNTELSS